MGKSLSIRVVRTTHIPNNQTQLSEHYIKSYVSTGAGTNTSFRNGSRKQNLKGLHLARRRRAEMSRQ